MYSYLCDRTLAISEWQIKQLKMEGKSVKKGWEKLIQLIQTFSDTRIGLLRGRDGLRCYGGRNDIGNL